MPYFDLVLDAARQDLTRHGVRELRTPGDVDDGLRAEGTAVVAVNSLCGCSAGRMRPAFVRALQSATARPDHVLSVFAGQDREATARAREYFQGYAPSSPSIFLLRDGVVVWALERRGIEGRVPEDIAADIRRAFEEHCKGGLPQPRDGR